MHRIPQIYFFPTCSVLKDPFMHLHFFTIAYNKTKYKFVVAHGMSFFTDCKVHSILEKTVVPIMNATSPFIALLLVLSRTLISGYSAFSPQSFRIGAIRTA